jgi:hypothetical protein
MRDDFSRQERLEILQGVLKDIQRIHTELKGSQRDTDNLAVEVETMRLSGSVSDFGYLIYQERLRRTREDINFCLRRLDGDRKRTLRQLFELDCE